MKTEVKAVIRTEVPVKELFIFAVVVSVIFGLIQLGYYYHLIKDYPWQ